VKLLRLWQSVTIAVVVVAFLAVPAFAVPVYEAMPGGAVSGTTGPIYDATPIPDYYSDDGADWGKAEVKYWYWQDAEDWWHYNYQIIINTITYAGGSGDAGAATDPPQGHHFGWFHNLLLGGDPDQYVGSFILSIVGLDQVVAGSGPPDLVVLGSAGSSAGGDAWDDFLDPGNTGLDWENKTGLQVDPTRWQFVDNGGTKNDYWEIVTLGETSTTDGGDPETEPYYFQIASRWEPDVVTAEIVVNGYTADETHVQLLAYGNVMGPVIIPEPATCLLFALGGLALVSKRRRTR